MPAEEHIGVLGLSDGLSLPLRHRRRRHSRRSASCGRWPRCRDRSPQVTAPSCPRRRPRRTYSFSVVTISKLPAGRRPRDDDGSCRPWRSRRRTAPSEAEAVLAGSKVAEHAGSERADLLERTAELVRVRAVVAHPTAVGFVQVTGRGSCRSGPVGVEVLRRVLRAKAPTRQSLARTRASPESDEPGSSARSAQGGGRSRS